MRRMGIEDKPGKEPQRLSTRVTLLASGAITTTVKSRGRYDRQCHIRNRHRMIAKLDTVLLMTGRRRR